MALTRPESRVRRPLGSVVELQSGVARYTLEREIAAGGMATVHLARVEGDGARALGSSWVAIKRLHPQYAHEQDFVSMLVDEARLVSRIRHPNVVRLLDVVRQDGELSLVMEYVHGESLAAHLRRTGAGLPPSVAVGVMAQVLDGLQAAHDACDEEGRPLRIVHRDVSPHNVLVGFDGVARLVDFGIAWAVWRWQSTREGQIKGKLPYMAPEQLQGRDVDRRADVYAASVVLWELLTGQPLVPLASPAKMMLTILAAEHVAPSRRGANVGADLDAIVLRGLSAAPDRRFASASELAAALRAAIAPAKVSAIARWARRAAPVESKAGPPAERRSVLWMLLAALAVVGVASGLVLWRARC